jgi:hypothetical protein
MRRLALSIAVAALLTGAPSFHENAANAQDVVATAKEQFQLGREASDKGDFAKARELFQKSYELHPTPGALLNLAVCEEQLGLIASAFVRFRQFADLVPSSDDRYASAKRRAAALEPRIPMLRIELAAGAPAGTTVKRDNIAVAGKNLGADLPVDPGKHAVVVTAPGREERRYEVTLAEGQKEALKVEPGAESAAQDPAPGASTTGPVTTAAPTAGIATPPPPSSGKRTAGFVLGGVGVAGLAVGGITGALTLSKTSDVETMCPNPDRCSTEGVAIADSARTLGLVSTVSFIAGAALVGTGVFLVLTGKPTAEAETAFAPVVLPGGAGFWAQRRF